MTPADPQKRPSAIEASQKFSEIQAGLTEFDLSQRIPPKTPEGNITRLYRDVRYRVHDSLWTRGAKYKKPLPQLDLDDQ